jgi:hypothetical protein
MLFYKILFVTKIAWGGHGHILGVMLPFSEAEVGYELLPVVLARQRWHHAWHWGICQRPVR